MTTKSSGFSLIELLVVVAIIGILSAVGTVSYQGYVKGARKSAAQNAMQQIALMQTEYYSYTGDYYANETCIIPSADDTSEINTTLFDTEADEAVIEVEKYNFCVQHETEEDEVVGYIVKAQEKPKEGCEAKDTCPKVFTLDSKGANNF